MHILRTPFGGLVAGLLSGILLVVAMSAAGFPSGEHKTELSYGEHSDEAASSFVSAKERNLNGTWLVKSRYVRTLEDGRTFTGEVLEAQDPPRRIRAGFGTVRAELDGFEYLCSGSPDQTNTLTCRQNARLEEYRLRVASELNATEALVLGDQRSYDVARDGKCFLLTQRPTATDSTWGTSTRFCFDQGTGAITLNEIRKAGGVDVYEAIEVETTPPEGTFILPLPAQ